MKTRVQVARPDKVKTDALILFTFPGKKVPPSLVPVDRAYQGQIYRLLKSGDFSGKEEEIVILYPPPAAPAKRLVIAGLGEKKKSRPNNLEPCRTAAGKAVRRARDAGAQVCHLLPPEGFAQVGPERLGGGLVEGSLLSLYQYEEYKSEKNKKRIKEMIVLAGNETERRSMNRGRQEAEIICDSANWVRDLINGPGNQVTPGYLAGKARELSRNTRIRVKVFGLPEIKKLRMGGLLAVSSGSSAVHPPRFIVLSYPGSGKTRMKPIILVGKGITFDSGGISIKPSGGMEEMKTDMAGAAAVLGTLRVAGRLRLSRPIVGLVPTTENLPSGSAYRPGDIIRTYSGQTIEVQNTDAEGRIILADALGYAVKSYRPEAVIDLATLTGACIVALGREASGLLSNNRKLAEKIVRAGEESGERVWELPLWDEYDKAIKSDVADMKNIGNREAGTITGAMFLKRYVGDTPWAHLDIAGTARAEKDTRYLGKGATGVGVRLLTRLIQNWQ